jgi:hypothetical protein
MYLKINKVKIPIEIKTSFKDKLKSFRLRLADIDSGLCFPKKRRINTYFYYQRVDLIMTDKDNKILSMFNNVPTERRYKGKKGTYFLYVFPVGVTDFYEIGETLNVTIEKTDKDLLESKEKKKKNS